LSSSSAKHVAHAIVGSGFGGLGMAIRLKQAGISDFAIFERALEIGGTWRDNTYPGCACDVESQLYSYSFAPHPGWSRMFSPQAEIQAYLIDCSKRFDVRSHIHFNHNVQRIVWDEAKKHWHLTTSKGEYTAKTVMLAMGPLSEPLMPKIRGLETFKGQVFHSARWDHDYDLSGKRVAVIGTGASAIQFVPEIQPQVARLHVFQRTAPWVVPRIDRPFKSAEQRRFARFPWLLRLNRLRIFCFRELIGLTFRHRSLIKFTRKVAVKHLQRAISSDAMRKQLTPNYEMGCKRVLISNNYYPALIKENVEVVTSDVREIGDDQIVSADGSVRPVDAIILGTGFRVTDFPHAHMIVGRGGRTLAEAWRGSPKAFVGTTVAGFPNLFSLLGPNTGLGHSSVVLMIEAQIEQILRILSHMRRRGHETVEVKAEAQDAYNAWIDKKSKSTVWLSEGCKSWYLDENGHNAGIWPMSVPAFQRRARRFSRHDFEFG
jgi:cation diffusion facilitator CzcD-associated flavoprotein CzcO